ncbi:hypothetical protein SSX86_015510 [Deinandra increscens subsp. villosa]|uniref:Uncharacterized protein n=1 Tax=Deinandra increscens subsp. villosa TaxID=3103831 RepID=A0AAP0D437_9ASTR
MGNPNPNPNPPPHSSSDQTPIHDNQQDSDSSSSDDDEDQINASTRSYEPENNTPPSQQPVPYPPPVGHFSHEPYPLPQEPTPYPPPAQAQPVPFPPPQPQSYNDNNKFYAQPQQTTINYQTQGIAVGSQYPTKDWSASNGLFDCANDTENAIITAFLPCVTFGQIAEVVDNGQTSCTTSGAIYCLLALTGIPCIMSCTYRNKIRNRYGLMETPAPDWITHCFCEWCALCQEFRELKAQGLNPAIGWQGNMMKNQQYATMTPPMNQTMM